MSEQASSCLTSIKSKVEITSFQFEDELWVCLSEVRPSCAAKQQHRFHIKEANFILHFSLKKNTVLDDVFVHTAFIYLMVFSNLTIQHCQ
jgi:hypothetical protein